MLLLLRRLLRDRLIRVEKKLVQQWEQRSQHVGLAGLWERRIVPAVHLHLEEGAAAETGVRKKAQILWRCTPSYPTFPATMVTSRGTGGASAPGALATLHLSYAETPRHSVIPTKPHLQHLRSAHEFREFG